MQFFGLLFNLIRYINMKMAQSENVQKKNCCEKKKTNFCAERTTRNFQSSNKIN